MKKYRMMIATWLYVIVVMGGIYLLLDFFGLSKGLWFWGLGIVAWGYPRFKKLAGAS